MEMKKRSSFSSRRKCYIKDLCSRTGLYCAADIIVYRKPLFNSQEENITNESGLWWLTQRNIWVKLKKQTLAL